MIRNASSACTVTARLAGMAVAFAVAVGLLGAPLPARSQGSDLIFMASHGGCSKPPTSGASHTLAVLMDAGLTREQIALLRGKGVIQ